MSNIDIRAKQLVAAGLPAILTSHLLFRADQDLFGASSNFWGGFVLVVGVASCLAGLARVLRSRGGDPR